MLYCQSCVSDYKECTGNAYEPAEHASDQFTTSYHHPNLKPLPSTAQVAYQQGAAIAYNLKALALGYALKPANVNMRGTLFKLGLNKGAANIFNSLEVNGEIRNLICQETYLELLPTPIHDFKAATE